MKNVLIVGGGEIATALCVSLSRNNIPCTMLLRDQELVDEYSRAVARHANLVDSATSEFFFKSFQPLLHVSLPNTSSMLLRFHSMKNSSSRAAFQNGAPHFDAAFWCLPLSATFPLSNPVDEAKTNKIKKEVVDPATLHNLVSHVIPSLSGIPIFSFTRGMTSQGRCNSELFRRDQVTFVTGPFSASDWASRPHVDRRGPPGQFNHRRTMTFLHATHSKETDGSVRHLLSSLLPLDNHVPCRSHWNHDSQASHADIPPDANNIISEEVNSSVEHSTIKNHRIDAVYVAELIAALSLLIGVGGGMVSASSSQLESGRAVDLSNQFSYANHSCVAVEHVIQVLLQDHSFQLSSAMVSYLHHAALSQRSREFMFGKQLFLKGVPHCMRNFPTESVMDPHTTVLFETMKGIENLLLLFEKRRTHDKDSRPSSADVVDTVDDGSEETSSPLVNPFFFFHAIIEAIDYVRRPTNVAPHLPHMNQFDLWKELETKLFEEGKLHRGIQEMTQAVVEDGKDLAAVARRVADSFDGRKDVFN